MLNLASIVSDNLFEITVKTGAMSSSGTSSGRNLAGIIHGSFSLVGSRVTITSPLAETEAHIDIS